MSLISKPVDWVVFNVPPIQPIQYYSILKKQREFSQLIKQYDSQVFGHSFLHYCGIVPKYLSSPLCNRCEIFIVFLNGTLTNSFIGFRVKVSKEALTYESKSLLIFLKKSGKSVFYSMNNNRIHVQCDTNAWELFYLLYDDFLRRYVLTIIGTRFFYHFVYSCCIDKEKQFLKLMSKGSKVIRISTSSIYYKVHRKRKVSVTDLIHMTLNMPKRRKCIISSFDDKESMLQSDVELGDFYTIAGKKINISKLTLKMYKTQFNISEKCTMASMLTDVNNKRKFDEISASENLETDASSQCVQVLESHSVANQWKEYQKLKFSLPNYSRISFMNTTVPSLLKQENISSCTTDLHSRIDLPPPLSYQSKEIEIKNFAICQDPCVFKDSRKSTCETSENLIETTFSLSKPENFASHDLLYPNNQKIISCTNNLNPTKSCGINSLHFSTNMKYNDCPAAEDANFTTAAGKVINISHAAMLKAHKLCEKEQILPEKIDCTIKQKIPESSVNEKQYVDSKKKSVSNECLLRKGILFESNSSFIQTENMPNKLAATHLSSTESLNIDNIHITEDVTFSTATGKKINVSNVAMEAAHKLIYNTSNEKESLNSECMSIKKKKFSKNDISNNGCTSKADDVDMDNTLVEKFFEDVHFDEKVLDITEKNVDKDNLKSAFEAKGEKCHPSRKPRKSLGGRRNLRFSDKL